MAKTTTGTAATSLQDVSITRVFDAPRAHVFKAWTDPAQIKKWWGPKDYTAPMINIDPRAGGRYFFCMRSPEGKDFFSTGVIRELVEPERIVLTDSFADELGNVVPSSHYGMDDFPLESVVTVTFVEIRGKTTMTVVHAGLPAGTLGDQTKSGWNESFDKLAASLRG